MHRSQMMREGIWLIGLLVTSAWLGCAQTRPPSESSETHFLMRCDQSCEDGLECICGTCSLPCEKDDACNSLPGAAQCLDSARDCSAGPLCDIECERDADCRALSENHVCEDGRCRAPASATEGNDSSKPHSEPDASALPP